MLTFGDFVTKSGRKTPYFVNTGNYKTGAQAARLGDYYAACIQENMSEGIDALFGPAYKGIPLVTTASASLSATMAATFPTALTARRPKITARAAASWAISPKTATASHCGRCGHGGYRGAREH